MCVHDAHTHKYLPSAKQQQTQHQSTSPLDGEFPAQSPFPLTFPLGFPFPLLFRNRSTASLSVNSSPPSLSPPPPSSPVFSPFSFISSRAMLNWARVRTICSMRNGPCAGAHTHLRTQTHTGERPGNSCHVYSPVYSSKLGFHVYKISPGTMKRAKKNNNNKKSTPEGGRVRERESAPFLSLSYS